MFRLEAANRHSPGVGYTSKPYFLGISSFPTRESSQYGVVGSAFVDDPDMWYVVGNIKVELSRCFQRERLVEEAR